MAAFFPRLIFADERRHLFSSPVNWVPGSISIVLAVSVAVALRVGHLQSAAITVLALFFEVVGSYGIAAAEFLQPGWLNDSTPWVGLSWAALFILMFNVIVP